MPKENHLCQICTKHLNKNGLPNHLKFVHNLNMKSYYDSYIKFENEDICSHPECFNLTNFFGLTKGYGDHCSKTCNATNPQLAKKRGAKGSKTKKDNPEIMKKTIEKVKETHRKNPDIAKNRTIKRMKTEANNPDIQKRRVKSYLQTIKDDPEIMLLLHEKRLKTFNDNPEIIKNATKKRLETEKNNPEIALKRAKKARQTMNDNPEIEERRRKNISISHRNYYKTLQKNYSEENHYLYIMENLTKPIIKIGLCHERTLRKRTTTISRDFGESKPILLLKNTHENIDKLESFLHDHFKEYCKVQPKGDGRTEWFDECILEEVKDILFNPLS